MDFADVVDELAVRLSVIAGLRIHTDDSGPVSGDSAIFGYPEDITFDYSKGRGLDRMTLDFMVVVPNPTSRSTRNRLAKYCTGSGEFSAKAALESTDALPASFHTVRVNGVQFGTVTIAGTVYMAALFTIDITGKGE